jgi:GntR family transcriptional regulator
MTRKPNPPPSAATIEDSDALLLTALGRNQRQGIAKYVALREAIAELIQSQAFAAGHKLPTESALVESTGLSLGTVQKAFTLLVSDGLVERRHGSGSYVSGAKAVMDSPLHCRFVNDEGTGYLPVYPQILSRERIPTKTLALGEHALWQRHLDAERIIRIDRLLRVGETGSTETFHVFSRFFVDAARFPMFADAPLKKLERENFKSLILRSSGLAVARIHQSLTVEAPTAEERKAMQLRREAGAHFLRVATFTSDGRPAYFQELRVPLLTRAWHFATDGRDPGPLERRAGVR